MGDGTSVDEVDLDLATAVGLLALSDGSVYQAADRAGIKRWKLEDRLEEGELAEALGIELDGDVAAEIDNLLDEHS